MQVRLAYGRQGLEVDLPDAHVIRTLSLKNVRPLADPAAVVDDAYARPTGTPPLAELAKGKKSASIVICDITRPVPNELILRPMLQQLEAAGIPRDQIHLLNATGMHRGNDRAELIEMVGEYIVDHYAIINHDGRDQSQHEFLGTSPRGVPMWIDKHYMQADLKITVGLIEPHFMAGYSGGRKLICPGIAHWETIRHWHCPAFLEHPNATMGILDGNPVHEENTYIAQQAGCDFIANIVIDDQRRPVHFVAGDMIEAFHAGVDFVRSVVVDQVPSAVDVVVTTSAGYPLDTTFYQCVKGMVAAAPIVKPGGTVVIAASLSEGIGSEEFQGLFKRFPSAAAFMEHIAGKEAETIDQWQLELLAGVLRKAKVKLVSDGLDAAVINGLFVESAPSVEVAVADCLREYGDAATIAVIPEGPYVVAEVAAA